MTVFVSVFVVMVCVYLGPKDAVPAIAVLPVELQAGFPTALVSVCPQKGAWWRSTCLLFVDARDQICRRSLIFD